MSHLNVAQAGSSSRPRVRLNKEGSAFLTNYAHTVTSHPTRAEKENILISLRAIHGNEEFTYQKLTGWFTRHRNPSGDPRAVLLDDETILFPKLTPTHIQQLRVLYKKRADPSDAIITFWADRIKAEKAEIAAWIRYQQEKAKEDDARATPESPEIPLQQLVGDPASVSPTFPRPHLPTPAKSPSISPHTRMPSLPPIAVKVEESRQCLSPVSSLGTLSFFNSRPANCISPSESRSVLEGIPPLSKFQQAKPPPVSPSIPDTQLRVGGQLHRQDSNRRLAANIRDSLRCDAVPNEQPPKTANEFSEKFERVEEMINAFMNKYDAGQLAGLGWGSSLSKAVS